MTAEVQQRQQRFPSRVVAAGLAALLLFTLGLIVISFPVGVYTVFFTELSGTFNASTDVSGIYIFVGPALAVLPLHASMGAFFLALSAVYAGMLILAALQGRGVFSAVRRGLGEGFEALLSNNLLATVVAIGFLAFTILLVDELETAAGVPIGGLTGDPMGLLMSLTIAPLREEAGFRLLIVGSVAAFASLGRPWRSALKALWRPSVVYEDVQNNTISKVALCFALAANAISFGLLHITSNSGWEVGKFPEAAYAGIVLGYLYIKYGFHVAVLTHWGINYLGSIFAFYGQGVFGIPWTSEPGYVLQQVVTIDMLELTGLVSFLAVAYIGVRRLVIGRTDATGL